MSKNVKRKEKYQFGQPLNNGHHYDMWDWQRDENYRRRNDGVISFVVIFILMAIIYAAIYLPLLGK